MKVTYTPKQEQLLKQLNTACTSLFVGYIKKYPDGRNWTRFLTVGAFYQLTEKNGRLCFWILCKHGFKYLSLTQTKARMVSCHLYDKSGHRHLREIVQSASRKGAFHPVRSKWWAQKHAADSLVLKSYFSLIVLILSLCVSSYWFMECRSWDSLW